MNGESPTLPAGLNGIPPVEVPAARLPSRSSTIAPTVSCPNMVSTQFGSGWAIRSSQIARSRSETRSAGSHVSTPAALGELARAVSCEDRERALEDAPRERDGVRDATDRHDRADLECLPVHDPGVELDEALLAQRGAAPGAEDAGALELADGSLDGVQRGAAVLQDLPAGTGRGEAALAMDVVLGWGDVEGTAVDRDRRLAAVRRHVASISPIGPVDLRPWPVIARTTVPLASRATADRARPACAAADVGSTKTPARQQRPQRRPDLVVGHLDDVAAGLADRRQDLPGTRRAVDADALGDRRSRRDGGRIRLAGPERARQRRTRGALDADEARHPIDQTGGPQAGVNPRWTPSSRVPPPSGATTASGARRPSCSKTS